MHSIHNLKDRVSKKIPIVFHNGSSYELAEKCFKKFICIGENNEKCITSTVPVVKEVTRIDKNGEKITKIYVTYHNLLIVQDL